MAATIVPPRQLESGPEDPGFTPAGPGGTGTVEDVAVTAGTGIAASVANPTDHPNVSIALAAISNLRILANISGGSAAPIPNTLSAILDAILGSTQGQLITRNAGTWTVLNPGTSGYALTSGGAGANLVYAPMGTVTSVGVTSTGSTLTPTGSPVTGSGSINVEINLAHQNRYTKPQNVAPSALVDAATISPNGTASNNFYLLLTAAVGASRAMNVPSGLSPGDFVNFECVQPASGGPCLIVWAAGFKWGPGGQDAQPVASTVASASDFYSFCVQNDGSLHGVMIGQSGPTGPGYLATSLTSLATAGSGSKAFSTQTGLAYTPGARMRATSVGTGEWMEGVVTAYAGGSLTMTADLNSGTGTHADWNINLAGERGPTGSTGPTGAAGAASSAGPSGTAGRLTLESGVPVSTTDQTAKTNIYFTPYKGNQIQLWDGAAWTTYTFTETTLAIGTLASATIPNDIFAYQSAGVLTLEKLAWTNASTRATAITIQDGRYCKSGDKTRLYLGSFYPTSTTTTEDSAGGTTTQVGGKRFLFNHYNQERRHASVFDSTASWNYSTATHRQSNGATGNKVEFMIGLATEMTVTTQNYASSTVAANIGFGVGIDSTTVNSAQVSGLGLPAGAGSGGSANYRGQLAAGYHALNWLEIGFGSGTQTWIGTSAGAVQIKTGLVAEATF